MTVQTDDPELHAEEAGLRYITDDRPGVRRRRAGKGFFYLGTDGGRITDPERIAWFNGLAIPPAWTEVWISPMKRGHIQATGRDARGRKQYRYHPRWREIRDQAKYGRTIEFARALPRIRRRTDRDLRRRGLRREKVLALVVRLLEATLIRVGNDEYVRENRSYGLSTMRTRHVEVEGAKIRFTFRGKGGKDHEIDVRDRRLVRLVRQCQELPGQELFQYLDADGRRQDVTSDDVNDYLREISGSRSPPRTSGPGPEPSPPPWPCPSSWRSTTTRDARRQSWAPSRRWPSSSATRRRCVERATSTPRSSTHTWMEPWSRRCRSGHAASAVARMRFGRRRPPSSACSRPAWRGSSGGAGGLPRHTASHRGARLGARREPDPA